MTDEPQIVLELPGSIVVSFSIYNVYNNIVYYVHFSIILYMQNTIHVHAQS